MHDLATRLMNEIASARAAIAVSYVRLWHVVPVTEVLGSVPWRPGRCLLCHAMRHAVALCAT